MAVTQIYVDPFIAGNSGTGTIGDPYGDLQYGLNTAVRNAVDGDQFNIKAGTAEFLAANLSLATYGAPTYTAPLILRGYTAAANDGGIGVINGAGSFGIVLGSTDGLHLIDLRITNIGGAQVQTRHYCSIQNCEVDTGTSVGIYPQGSTFIYRCYVHDFTSNAGIYLTGGSAFYNYVSNCGAGGVGNMAITLANPGTRAYYNIVIPKTNTPGIWVAANGNEVVGNVVYAAASTAKGIYANASATGLVITNNIVEGFSGAGGVGIDVPATCVMSQYHSNAVYNCTTAYNVLAKFLGVSANNDTLAASPFVNAGAGDFDINGTVAGVTEDAWPSSFHSLASTSPKADKGAVQAGAGAGGAVSISPFRGQIG